MSAPAAPLTYGIDVSSYERGGNVAAAAAAGDAFLIAKATQGIHYRDSTCAGFLADGRAAGMLLAAYHFGDASDPVAQADFFLSVVQPLGQDILLCLDWETNPNHAAGTMSIGQARAFVQRVHDRTGRWPMLYSGASRLHHGVTDSSDVLANCPLWEAEYGGFPTAPPAWSDWSLFQYTDGTYGPSDQATYPRTTAGFHGHVDRSVFQGSRDALAAWWASAGGQPSTLPPDGGGGGLPGDFGTPLATVGGSGLETALMAGAVALILLGILRVRQ